MRPLRSSIEPACPIVRSAPRFIPARAKAGVSTWQLAAADLGQSPRLPHGKTGDVGRREFRPGLADRRRRDHAALGQEVLAHLKADAIARRVDPARIESSAQTVEPVTPTPGGLPSPTSRRGATSSQRHGSVDRKLPIGARSRPHRKRRRRCRRRRPAHDVPPGPSGRSRRRPYRRPRARAGRRSAEGGAATADWNPRPE